MSHQQRNQQFRPLLSDEDLTLILSALSAYMHNTRYRPVYERLHYQATRLGLNMDPA